MSFLHQVTEVYIKGVLLTFVKYLHKFRENVQFWKITIFFTFSTHNLRTCNKTLLNRSWLNSSNIARDLKSCTV